MVEGARPLSTDLRCAIEVGCMGACPLAPYELCNDARVDAWSFEWTFEMRQTVDEDAVEDILSARK